MKKYKTAVFGTTVLAAAVAETLGGGAVVIEKSESAATDCTSCINMPYSKIYRGGSPKTEGFFKDLEERNLIGEDGTVHVFPVAGVTAKRFIMADTLLSTDVISVGKAAGGYEITIFNIDGFSKIYAENILDTTPTGVINTNPSELNFTKYLRSLISGEGEPEEAAIVRGRFENEFTYSVEAEKYEGYSSAARRLHEAWQKIAVKNRGYEMSAVAPQFAYIYDAPVRREIDKNYIFVPSASFADLGSAYEEGVHAAELFI